MRAATRRACCCQERGLLLCIPASPPIAHECVAGVMALLPCAGGAPHGKHGGGRPAPRMGSPRLEALQFGALVVKSCLAGFPSDVKHILVDVVKLREWLAGIPADVLARITMADDVLQAALGYENKIFDFISFTTKSAQEYV